MNAAEIAQAIKRADTGVYCLAVVRLDPVRRADEIIGAEIDSSTVELVTADPRRIKTALTKLTDGPGNIARTIEETARAVREAPVQRRWARAYEHRPQL